MPMEWLITIRKGIFDFPGRWQVRALLFVATLIVSSAFSGFITDGLKSAEAILKMDFVTKSMISISIAGIIYALIDFYRSWLYCDKALRLETDVLSVFEKEFLHSKTIRVFASKGEASKTNFIGMLKHQGTGGSRISVKVLLRGDDSSPGRANDLENQMQTWRKDIDEQSQSRTYPIETKFSIYKSQVMLSGYIFDDRCAILSWYSKIDGNRRSNPGMPRFIVYSEPSGAHKEVVSQAIKMFDEHFEQGKIP
jgi:hypothetical protein